MEKQLRILGLVAVLGATAIVVSQGARGPASPGPGAQGGTDQVAAQSSDGLANDVLRALSQYICSVQSYALTQAEVNGHPERSDAIIRVNCAASLSILTPEKQKGLLAVFQIDKYQPNNPKWAAVARTPSAVKELLNVSPEANKAARQAMDNFWAPIMKLKPWEEELYATDAFKKATQAERSKMHWERNQIEQQKNPPAPLIDRRRGAVESWEREVKSILPTLTANQRAEFTRILDQHAKDTKAALDGLKP